VSLHAYRESLRIDADSFSALIMAAYRKADTANEAKLRAAWPELCVEMQYRYWSAGGLMPGEDGYDPAGDDNLTSDEATS
jgi:hypothetical protein